MTSAGRPLEFVVHASAANRARQSPVLVRLDRPPDSTDRLDRAYRFEPARSPLRPVLMWTAVADRKPVVELDGPARAVRCAEAIVETVRPLGFEVRAGCHTGEIELEGEHVRDIAVHIGARVGALAGPGEVLVSSTVRDLVAGSGLAFEDAREHELKGVPNRWHPLSGSDMRDGRVRAERKGVGRQASGWDSSLVTDPVPICR
jgi:class 3 adenylate cyclase